MKNIGGIVVYMSITYSNHAVGFVCILWEFSTLLPLHLTVCFTVNYLNYNTHNHSLKLLLFIFDLKSIKFNTSPIQ